MAELDERWMAFYFERGLDKLCRWLAFEAYYDEHHPPVDPDRGINEQDDPATD